eukprot:1696463-Rhodomonas_salina.6
MMWATSAICLHAHYAMSSTDRGSALPGGGGGAQESGAREGLMEGEGEDGEAEVEKEEEMEVENLDHWDQMEAAEESQGQAFAVRCVMSSADLAFAAAVCHARSGIDWGDAAIRGWGRSEGET